MMMKVRAAARNFLKSEAHALLTRINRVESFALHTPMVPAATIPLPAQTAIEVHLSSCRMRLRDMIHGYLRWLDGPEAVHTPQAVAHRRFSLLRLRFIAILTQLDIFANVLNQRSEHDTGVWLSGLDVFAADALSPAETYRSLPPVICYLDRGAGAAIRRARTRLPGGDPNPVAVIQVPRERMIGSGIASSLVHEVGHQASAVLDFEASLRPLLGQAVMNAGHDRMAWLCWQRWISEILADFWSVARLGVIGTMGLMSVVSLPRPFVFRVDLEDPHPSPYIRVKLSCAMGQAIYPNPQWEVISKLWESFYPLEGLDERKRAIFAGLERNIPKFASMLLEHRPKSLEGRSLMQAVASADRMPERLRSAFAAWRRSPDMMKSVAPTLAFAVIGQAKMDSMISPKEESKLLSDLLKFWALKITLDTSAICADVSRSEKQKLII